MLAVVVVTMISMMSALSARAQVVPAGVNYQGVLVGDQGELTGNLELKFYVVKGERGSTDSPVWGPQTFPTQPITRGRFNVILTKDDVSAGEDPITDAFDGADRHLVVKAGGTEISRQKILSAPYAIRAASATNAATTKRVDLKNEWGKGDDTKGQIYWSDNWYDKGLYGMVFRKKSADSSFGFYSETEGNIKRLVRIDEEGLGVLGEIRVPSCRICLIYSANRNNAPDFDSKHDHLRKTCVPLIPNSVGTGPINTVGGNPANDRIWLSFECKVPDDDGNWVWPESGKIEPCKWE